MKLKDTTTEQVAKEESDKLDERIETEVLPDERKKTFRTPGFQRMRTDWDSSDRPIVDRARAAVEGRILKEFAGAYQIMFDVYDLVRTPEVDENGEIITDIYGLRKWKKSPSGSYEEDFSKLTTRQKENFLFVITTRLFEWEQEAANAWGESMLAKAQWEERFSIGFDSPMTGTVDDRRAAGNLDARDERYFAIFLATYSRKADAIVRSLQLLGQRLKDSMQS